MRIAAIDIGSYSTRLTVADVDGNEIRPILEKGRITSLGSGVKETGYLQRDRMRETLEVLREYSEDIRRIGVDRVLAVGTEALRRAKNSEEFIKEVKEETGIEIKVISSQEEGRLAYLATAYGLGLKEESLVVDQGGGSTEFIFGKDFEVKQIVSLPMGIVNLTESFIKSDPPSGGDIDRLYEFLEREITPLRRDVSQIVGLGGTITTVVALEYGVYPYDSRAVHGRELSLDSLKRWFDTLARLPYRERSRTYRQVEDKRAEVIVAGIAMFIKILEIYGKDFLKVSDWGLKHGLLVSALLSSKA